MTYALNLYRPQDGENGAAYADGDYAATGRISVLPIYEKDAGNCYMGFSGTWRHNRNGYVDFAAQPEIYDFAGGRQRLWRCYRRGGTTVSNLNASVAAAGTPAGANNANMIDTGKIFSESTTVFGTEFLYICGRFPLQAEYIWLRDGTQKGGSLTAPMAP